MKIPGQSKSVESPELPKIDTLAGRLKWAFERGTLNGTKVASACGVTRAAVSGWLTGRTDNIKLETFFAVARVLGVDPEWLATGKTSGFPEYVTQESVDLASKFGRLSPTLRAAIITITHAALGESKPSQFVQSRGHIEE